ncbi:MAG: SRPBCC domain-containing protein [Actinomycetota bacterium]|nr:SRPBCC domain-containing protein [Actinomycetota bacterium]
MTSPAVWHHTFVLERTYPVSPARVFQAQVAYDQKRRWFAEGEGFEVLAYTLDCTPGGAEHALFKQPDGIVVAYDAQFHEVLPDERIVASYAMAIEGSVISVSLATTELVLVPEGTLMRFTEQGAYIGDEDQLAGRIEGTEGLLAALGHELKR